MKAICWHWIGTRKSARTVTDWYRLRQPATFTIADDRGSRVAPCTQFCTLKETGRATSLSLWALRPEARTPRRQRIRPSRTSRGWPDSSIRDRRESASQADEILLQQTHPDAGTPMLRMRAEQTEVVVIRLSGWAASNRSNTSNTNSARAPSDPSSIALRSASSASLSSGIRAAPRPLPLRTPASSTPTDTGARSGREAKPGLMLGFSLCRIVEGPPPDGIEEERLGERPRDPIDVLETSCSDLHVRPRDRRPA